jgi:hypothetical protein
VDALSERHRGYLDFGGGIYAEDVPRCGKAPWNGLLGGTKLQCMRNTVRP